MLGAEPRKVQVEQVSPQHALHRLVPLLHGTAQVDASS